MTIEEPAPTSGAAVTQADEQAWSDALAAWTCALTSNLATKAAEEVIARHRLAAAPADSSEPWHTDRGSLLEAQRVTRQAYAAIERAKAQNTHIPGNPYDVALSALNSPLAALDTLLTYTHRLAAAPADSAEVERMREECARIASDERTAAIGNLEVGYRPAHNAGRREAAERIEHRIRALADRQPSQRVVDGPAYTNGVVPHETASGVTQGQPDQQGEPVQNVHELPDQRGGEVDRD